MNPTLNKYPLDLRGESTDNFVANEYHGLAHRRGQPYRAFVLDHGYFFTDSVVIRDQGGTELIPDFDFMITHHSSEASKLTGQSVSGMVVILNTRVTDDVYVDAQMVGGDYCSLTDILLNAIETLQNDTRSVDYQNIRGRPTAFTPGGHLHGLWELYGFDPYRAKILEMVEANLSEHRDRLDDMRAYVDREIAAKAARRARIEADLVAHRNDLSNPHRVTKAQAQLSELLNYPLSTVAEGEVGTATNRYLNPPGGAGVIAAQFLSILNAHVNDTANPHRLTAALVGTHTKQEADDLLAQRLPIDATAVDSERLDGKDSTVVLDNIRTDLEAESVTSQRISTPRIGGGIHNASTVMVGDGTFRSIQDIFDEYQTPATKVIYVGYLGPYPGLGSGDARWGYRGNVWSRSTIMNYLNNTYGNLDAYPIGSIVMYRYFRHNYGENGNGSTWVVQSTQIMEAAVRQSGGWTHF